jgi:hypothetical protein
MGLATPPIPWYPLQAMSRVRTVFIARPSCTSPLTEGRAVSPLSSVLRGSVEPRAATCTVCRVAFELYFARRARGIALECWISGLYLGTAIWSNAVAWTSCTLAGMSCSLHPYYYRSFEPSTVHLMTGVG